MYRVINLTTAPEYFDDVFESIYSEWGDNNPQYWKSWIKSSMRACGIPSTYVVLDDKQYLGTFSLWNCDLQSRQDLSPWLGGIVVNPNYRGQGIGLYIQEQAKEILRREGVKQVYLFTETIGFYEKTGWVFDCQIYDEKDHLVRLYKLCL